MTQPKNRPETPAATWTDYVRRVAGNDRQIDISDKTGVDQATISKWMRGGGGVSPRAARAFAHGYDQSVLEAFVAAGIITAEEAVYVPPPRIPLDQMSTDELLDAIRKRLPR